MNSGIGKDRNFIIESGLAGLVNSVHLPLNPRASIRQSGHHNRSNSVIYRVCSAILAVFYFGSVLFLEGFIRQGIGLFGQSQAAIFISTLCAAALCSPLRRWIQKTIDRRYFRQNYNAELTLRAFSAAVHNEVDLDQLSVFLVNLVEETIQPSRVSLWLNDLKNSEVQNRAPAPPHPPTPFPTRGEGEQRH